MTNSGESRAAETEGTGDEWEHSEAVEAGSTVRVAERIH